MGVLYCNEADVKGDMNYLVDGLCQDTFDSYASNRHSVDQLLLAIRKRLREMFICETMVLLQSVCDAHRNAASCA